MNMNIETNESSFIIKNSFVKFMKYPNSRNSIHRMNIGYDCDLERFGFGFFLLIRAYGTGPDGGSIRLIIVLDEIFIRV